MGAEHRCRQQPILEIAAFFKATHAFETPLQLRLEEQPQAVTWRNPAAYYVRRPRPIATFVEKPRPPQSPLEKLRNAKLTLRGHLYTLINEADILGDSPFTITDESFLVGQEPYSLLALRWGKFEPTEEENKLLNYQHMGELLLPKSAIPLTTVMRDYREVEIELGLKTLRVLGEGVEKLFKTQELSENSTAVYETLLQAARSPFHKHEVAKKGIDYLKTEP